MAIQKQKILKNGSIGNYWRILDITLDRQNFKATGRIALFKDKATSDAGKPHLGEIKTFAFTFTIPELVGVTNVIAYMYGKIITKAQSLITMDILGNILDTPVVFDPDLASGTMV